MICQIYLYNEYSLAARFRNGICKAGNLKIFFGILLTNVERCYIMFVYTKDKGPKVSNIKEGQFL